MHCSYVDLVYLCTFSVWGCYLVSTYVPRDHTPTFFKVIADSSCVFPNPSHWFTFDKCKYTLVQSSTAPGLSVGMTLTGYLALPRLRWYSVCAFHGQPVSSSRFADSVLHIFLAQGAPTLAHFHLFLMHHSSSTWSFFSSLSVRCVNFSFFFFISFVLLF